MKCEHKREPRSPERDRILILGGSSYVGRHLSVRLGSARAIATYNGHPTANGVHFDALSMRVSNIIETPERISHTIILLGDTDPETCAADPERSNALNVESIKRIIDDILRMGIKPVFTSSEFVFDGTKGNYVESDPVNPILLYGQQKVEIEQYLQECCDDYVIVRLAKVFGAQRGDGTLFTNWLDAIEQGRTIRCAQDQVFSPVYIADVVGGIIRLIETDGSGVFHLSNRTPFNRLALLEMLLSCVNDVSPVEAEVVPCSIHDFDLMEKRPLDVSMVPDKFIAATGFQIGDVQTVCRDIVERAFRNV